nr:hypothetical protein [Pseudomonas putida]
MTERIRPRLATHTLDLNVICDICGKPRTVGRHTTCSQTRKQRMAPYWAALMANRAAKQAQGKRT